MLITNNNKKAHSVECAFLFGKPSCIAAFSAKFFGRAAAGKSVVYCLGAGRRQNFVKREVKQIAESKHAVGIQAAGNTAAVNENAYLVAQAVAGEFCSFNVARKIRPFKPLAPICENSVIEAKFKARFCFACDFSHVYTPY